MNGVRNQITRPRAVALTVLAVALTVAIVALIGDDGGESTEGPTATAPPAEPALPTLRKTTASKAVGIKVQRPRGWVATRKQGAIRLRTRDRSTQVVISSPAGARAASHVFRAAVASFRRGYRRVSVALQPPAKLAGLPAASARIIATNKHGTRITALVIVARGRKHAYLVEVLSPRRGGRLGDAQLILSRGLKLTR